MKMIFGNFSEVVVSKKAKPDNAQIVSATPRVLIKLRLFIFYPLHRTRGSPAAKNCIARHERRSFWQSECSALPKEPSLYGKIKQCSSNGKLGIVTFRVDLIQLKTCSYQPFVLDVVAG